MKNKAFKSIIFVIVLAAVVAYSHYYMTDVYNEVLNYILVKRDVITLGDNIVISSYTEVDNSHERKYNNAYKTFSYRDYLKLKEKIAGEYSYYVSKTLSGSNKSLYNLVIMDDDDFERVFNKRPNADTVYVNNDIYENSDKLLNFNSFYIKNKKLFFNDDVPIDIEKIPMDKKTMIDQSVCDIIYPSRFQTVDIESGDIPWLNESIIMPVKYIDNIKTLLDDDDNFVRINLNGTNHEKLISEMYRLVYSKDYKDDATRDIIDNSVVSFNLANGLEETRNQMNDVVISNVLKLILCGILIIALAYIMDKKYYSIISIVLGIGLSVFYRWQFDKELYLLWIHAQFYVLITIIIFVAIGAFLSSRKKAYK